MKDRNIQARKEIHSRLYDRIWNIGHEGWHKQVIYHFLIEEECASGYNQNNTRILTDSYIWDIQRWKVAITLVSQGYESTKRRQDYKTGTGTTYRERDMLMDMERLKIILTKIKGQSALIAICMNI